VLIQIAQPALPPPHRASSTPTPIPAAGPGFINIRVSSDWLASHLTTMLRTGIESWAPAGFSGQRVIVDFSSPNVAKEMHVGHLRSTIIGDTLARTLEFCGADVLRLNHIVSRSAEGFGFVC
jgi:arginyl-tRNA synthetase